MVGCSNSHLQGKINSNPNTVIGQKLTYSLRHGFYQFMTFFFVVYLDITMERCLWWLGHGVAM